MGILDFILPRKKEICSTPEDTKKTEEKLTEVEEKLKKMEELIEKVTNPTNSKKE